MDTLKEGYRRQCLEQYELSKAVIEVYEGELRKDPLEAFKWGSDALQAAARVKVYGDLYTALRGTTTLQEARALVLEEITQKSNKLPRVGSGVFTVACQYELSELGSALIELNNLCYG